jgi:hypothetical protein
MPREARGQYDAVKCMLFYIRYLQRALEKKSVPMADGGYAGEREERIRLLRADADRRIKPPLLIRLISARQEAEE